MFEYKTISQCKEITDHLVLLIGSCYKRFKTTTEKLEILKEQRRQELELFRMRYEDKIMKDLVRKQQYIYITFILN